MIVALLACVGPDAWDADRLEGKPQPHAIDSGEPDTADTVGTTDSVDSSVPIDTDTGTPVDTQVEPDACAPLAASGDAATNVANLNACLADRGRVDLGSAVFPIDSGIALPAGTSLTGTGGTLQLTAETTNFVLTTNGGNTVRGVRLDGNAHVWDVNGSVLHITGSNSTVSDVWIGDSTGGASSRHTCGVYVIDTAASNNTLSNVEITGTFYGAIFVAGLDSAHPNTITTSTIHETWCDGVTFAGYGELTDSTLYHSGVDCDNGPIPGASVYGLTNHAGAYIARNTMYDDCGNIVDLDDVQGFILEDNVVYDPGYQWEGWAPWCSGSSMAIIDSSYLTIQDNVVENNNRTQNRLSVGGDPNGVFSGSGMYGDAPAGGETIVAFWLGQRPASAGAVVGSTIAGNQLRAACSADCTGVGYFVSRGTGYDSAGGWSASTTNYFTENDPVGSNVGSTRCGGNWYAANSTCTEATTDADCNLDDYQHTYDWSRNDGCYGY